MSVLRTVFVLCGIATYGLAQPGTTPYVISTAAGIAPVSGDNGPATSAFLRLPQFVVVDRVGNLYFSESWGAVVRKVTPDGIITTVAGTGLWGNSPDGGQAASSKLGNVQGVGLDGGGTLYFADSNFGRVRKISRSGVLTTVAGTGVSGYGGDGGPAIQAQFADIQGITFDQAGNLYIADRGNQRIRKVDTIGIVTTVAGNGTPGSSGDGGPAALALLNFPSDVVLDASGSLYIADRNNHRIRKVTASGAISTYAGTGISGGAGDGGNAGIAQLSSPTGLAIDSFGRLYVTSGFFRVRRITPTVSGPFIETVVGNGTGSFQGDGGQALNAGVDLPWGLTVDASDNLYLAEGGISQRIRKVSAGIISTVAGVTHFAGDNGPAVSALLSFPQSVAADGLGNVYIADTSNLRIRQITPDGKIRTLAGNGTQNSSGDGGSAIVASLNTPNGVAVDSAGNVYAADGGNQRIRKISPAGVITTIAGTGAASWTGDGGPATDATMNGPMAVVVDSHANIYFADQNNHRIRRIDARGTITTIAGTGTAGPAGDGGPAIAAQLNFPSGVALDAAGNLYIADRSNFRVRMVDSNGRITTIAGTGQPGFSGDGGPATAATMRQPAGIAIDNAGNIFIGDLSNGRIRMVNPSGIITTIAGNGTLSYSGDNGLATAATFGGSGVPSGLALGPGGVIYFADFNNQVVRKLIPNVPSLLKIVSGNNQSGPVGTQLSVALVVSPQGPTGVAIAGVTVSFAVTSGSATLSASSVVTGTNGQAGIAATLGAGAGAVTVTASAAGLSPALFNLTATPPQVNTGPQISTGGVVGAGLSVPLVTQLSANSIVSIFGQNFAPAGSPLATVGGGDLVGGKVPTQFAGVCVEVNSQRAPIFLVLPGQLNLQVPAIPQSGRVTVQVIANCGQSTEARSAAVTVAVQAATPEFFFFEHNTNGQNAIAALNAVTGAYVGPPNLIPGATFVPAQPGDIVSIFMTGLGATSPSYDAGVLPPGIGLVSTPASVTLGSLQLPAANILYAGVAPLNPGLYQVNIQIPDGAPTGNVPLTLTVGPFSTPAGGYLAVGR